MQVGIADSRGTADLGFLRYVNDYPSYFQTLQHGCGQFLDAYHVADIGGVNNQEGRFELKATTDFVGRLLASLAALRLRYAYQRDGERPLYVDLSDSGFPNFHEISHMESDAADALSRLAQLPARPALTRRLADRIMAGEADPKGELAEFSERAYLERLLDPRL